MTPLNSDGRAESHIEYIDRSLDLDLRNLNQAVDNEESMGADSICNEPSSP